VLAEHAKAAPDDILIRVTVSNRGPEAARLHLLPTLWFRNTWVWGSALRRAAGPSRGSHKSGRMRSKPITSRSVVYFCGCTRPGWRPPAFLFTDNESSRETDTGSHAKDAFHRCDQQPNRRNQFAEQRDKGRRTHHPGRAGEVSNNRRAATLRRSGDTERVFGSEFDRIFAERIEEANAFYATRIPQNLAEEERRIVRQAYAGLLWSKQFYHYVVAEWLSGDRGHPNPPDSRRHGHNADWPHLHSREVLSVPDKWE
jgi:hypothetical protein